MKKFTTLFYFIAFITFISATPVQPQGTGSEIDPYIIESLDNLEWFSVTSTSWDKHFIQVTDIDASDTQNWNGGEGFIPIGNGSSFYGTYDGQYNKISNLYINRPTTNNQAMFHRLHTSGRLDNIILENISVSGNYNVGALVGFVNQGHVTNCSSSGSVSASGTAGGLFGTTYNGAEVSQCSSTCSISGQTYLGGLIGNMSDYCVIANCYARGSVSGNNTKGGLIGSSYYLYQSQVYNSYSTGYVSPGSWSGGLIGDDGVAYNCFWDMQTSSMTSSDGGTGKVTSEMLTISTYTDLTTVGLDAAWDFTGTQFDDTANEDIWTFSAGLNDNYPIHTWQLLKADFASVTAATTGDTIAFSDLSTGNPTTWAWDFDNNGSVDSNDENPQWVYSSPGVYTVKLTVSGALGTDVETKTDYITIANPSTSNGLVAYYPLGDDSDDYSGNNYHGTPTNVTPSVDRFGINDKAYSFNGTSLIEIPRMVQDDFTIAFWLKTNMNAGGSSNFWDGPGLVCGEVNGITNDYGITYGINQVNFGTGNPDVTISSSNLSDNQWHFVTVTRNMTTGANKLFIDNNLVATATGSTLPLTAETTLRIGKSRYNMYFNGSLDDFRFYDRVLFDSEIDMLFNEPASNATREITLDSESSIDYGQVYYGTDSSTNVVLTNTGNVIVSLSEISIVNDSEAFAASDESMMLNPGQTDTILVSFTPDAETVYSDTLRIVNNSTNNPVISIPLTGEGVYDNIPAPQNVNIALVNGNAEITWDAVTETEHDIDVSIDFYVINYSETAENDPDAYYHLTATTDTSFVHTRVAQFSESMYYQVIAIRDYQGEYTTQSNGNVILLTERNGNIESQNSRKTWGEVKKELKIAK